MTQSPKHDVDFHFSGRPVVIRKIYDALISEAGKFGPVEEDPKKTSIHLNRKSAFAAVRTRHGYIWLTLKSDAPIETKRVFRSQHASANRWYSEIKLSDPADVDSELVDWLGRAYEISA